MSHTPNESVRENDDSANTEREREREGEMVERGGGEEEEAEETRRSLSTLSCVLPRSEKSHVRAV